MQNSDLQNLEEQNSKKDSGEQDSGEHDQGEQESRGGNASLEQSAKRNAAYIREEATHQLGSLKKTKESEDYQEAMQESGPYLTLGIQMAISIALFAGIGYWIDSANGTSPRWLGIFSGGGAVLSLFYFIMTVLRLSKNEETNRHKN